MPCHDSRRQTAETTAHLASHYNRSLQSTSTWPRRTVASADLHTLRRSLCRISTRCSANIRDDRLVCPLRVNNLEMGSIITHICDSKCLKPVGRPWISLSWLDVGYKASHIMQSPRSERSEVVPAEICWDHMRIRCGDVTAAEASPNMGESELQSKMQNQLMLSKC